MYVLGLIVFVLGSAMAALSPGTGTLIAARVVQGAGAAMLVPLTLTLISEAFPAEKRGAAIGIWGGITGLGVAAGPVVGGAIVQGISWQWIFWLNVPVGLAVAALSALRLRESRGPRPQLDFIGMVLAGIALFALTWAPVRAPSAGWGSSEVIGSFVAGGVPGRFPGLGTTGPVSDAAAGLLPPARLRHRQRGDLLPVHLADRVPVLHHPAVPDRAGLLAAPGWPADPGLDGHAHAGRAGRRRAR
jgi:MFS family permease